MSAQLSPYKNRASAPKRFRQQKESVLVSMLKDFFSGASRQVTKVGTSKALFFGAEVVDAGFSYYGTHACMFVSEYNKLLSQDGLFTERSAAIKLFGIGAFLMAERYYIHKSSPTNKREHEKEVVTVNLASAAIALGTTAYNLKLVLG